MENNDNLKLENPDIRRLFDLKDVLYDQKWFAEQKDNFDLYYMYRGIERKDGLRYDITVVPAKMLGVEFNKTKGHYHPDQFGELYIVLSGKAFYLMQKKNEKGGVEDVYAVEAKAGDSVVIPPEYGHITINHGTEELKMANWTADGFESTYSPIEEKRGGAFYLTEKGWIENRNYAQLPALRFEKPEEKIPEDLSFLN